MSKLRLEFNDKPITVAEAFEGLGPQTAKKLSPQTENLWRKTKNGESFQKVHPKGSRFNQIRLHSSRPSNTLTAHSQNDLSHFAFPRRLSDAEVIRLQTFPDDYRIRSKIKAGYVCGMSVPPLMTKRIAEEVLKQWL